MSPPSTALPASPRRSRSRRATRGVTVNCISPGYVWTPLVENQIPDTMKARNLTREQVMNDVLLAAQPTKKFVTVDQVAALALFLCRDEAASITGANLSDGRRLDRGLGSGYAYPLLSRRAPWPCACTTSRQAVRRAIAAADWRSVVTVADAKRLRDWRSDLRQGAGSRRAPPATAPKSPREGRLLMPDAAIPGALANGDYRCRIIKLGAKAPATSITSLTPPSPAAWCRMARAAIFQQIVRLAASDGLHLSPPDEIRQVFPRRADAWRRDSRRCATPAIRARFAGWVE